MSMIEALSSAGIPQKEFKRMFNVTEIGNKENKTSELYAENKEDRKLLRRFCIYEEKRKANQLAKGDSETEPE